MSKSTDQIVRKLLEDLEYYANNNIYIKPKSGIPCKLFFNKAQKYIHNKLEEQKYKMGRVRAIILKGRQQGCSTYVGARFYHRTVCNKGVYTFIFAHDSHASRTLFENVNMMYGMSDHSFRPKLGASNARELLFPTMGSGYKVGTAGTKGLGRSKTFQQVHWSEVAYSPNCEDHAAGILQTVSDHDGTEIILESTANRQSDFFHRMCMSALAGESDYQIIFVPWYWQDEYCRTVQGRMALTEEEEKYMSLYEKDGLRIENLEWRRRKIKDFENDHLRFKKEYPFNINEAFEANNDRVFIHYDLISRACSAEPAIQLSKPPLIMGLDPAWKGKDLIVMCLRRGRNVEEIRRFPPMETTQLIGLISRIINQEQIDFAFIDVGGLGIGIGEGIRDNGFGKIVRLVNFAKSADDSERYANKRCEMYARAKIWLEDEPCSIRSSDKKALHALQSQISNVLIDDKEHKQRFKLESKDDIRSRNLPSPDYADAFVLTFAQNVCNEMHKINFTRPIQPKLWSPFNER